MKPNEYNYRIVYKDGTFYILIDKKSSNINVLQIKKKLEKIVKKYKLPYNTDNVKIYVVCFTPIFLVIEPVKKSL